MQPGGHFDHAVSIFGLMCKTSCLHDNIRLGKTASFVFLGVLTLFFLFCCFLFKISKLYSFL